MHVEYSAGAKADLKSIYNRGMSEYGAPQTRLFLALIYKEINRAADYPKMFREVRVNTSTLRKIPVKSHTIYYRINSDHIEIVRILGRQNPPGQF